MSIKGVTQIQTKVTPMNLCPGELILKKELLKLVPLAYATIWREEQRGKFPKKIYISPKRVAWRRSEVEAWLAERIANPVVSPFREELAGRAERARAAIVRAAAETAA